MKNLATRYYKVLYICQDCKDTVSCETFYPENTLNNGRCGACDLKENIRLAGLERRKWESSPSFYAVSTVNYKDYKKNGGNVSLARVNAIKNRCLAPDGNGEVVQRGRDGRPTDKRATL